MGFVYKLKCQLLIKAYAMTAPKVISESTLEQTSLAPETQLTPAQLADAEVQHQHEDLITQQMPAWFKDATLLVRESLRQTMTQWHATQAEVAAVYARITPIEQFATPLLKSALSFYGWSSIEPKIHGFKQVRLLNNAVIFIANQQTKVVDSLAKLFCRSRWCQHHWKSIWLPVPVTMICFKQPCRILRAVKQLKAVLIRGQAFMSVRIMSSKNCLD